MRNKWIFIFLFVALGLWAAIKIVEIQLEAKLRVQLEDGAKKLCASCKLKVKSLDIDLLFLRVSLGRVEFSGGRRVATLLESRAEKIDLDFRFPFSGLKNLSIKKIDIETPEFVVTEGDETLGPAKSTPTEMELIIENIFISDASFTYVRERNGYQAPVHIKEIEGAIRDIHFGKKISPESAEKSDAAKKIKGEENWASARFAAKLEDSGDVQLKIKTLSLSEPLDIQIELKVENQSLAQLNPYFVTHEGVVLKGILLNGFGTTLVKGRQASSTVEAKYKNLDFQFNKNDKRSAATAFFSNLIKTLKLDEASTDENRKDRTKTVSIQREEQETLVSFILRSLKESALKVATTDKDSKN